MNLVGITGVGVLFSVLGAEGFGIQLPSWVTESLKQSPGLVFALVVFWVAFKHIQAEHTKHVASKDQEIDRLVKERDKLQNILLRNRLSTEEPPPPSDPKAKPGPKPKKK